MPAIGKLKLRLRSLLQRRKMEAELEAELQFHADQLEKELLSGGVPQHDARRAALRSMGNLTQYQERCRDMRGVNFWDDLLRDIGYAWRSWARTPLFFLSIILILAAGIGVNSAVFTVVRSVVLNPLPYPRAEQLVALWKIDAADSTRRSGVAPADFLDLQHQSHTCASVAAFANTFFDVTDIDDPYRVVARQVSSSFFSTLGVQPGLGRDFTAEDDRPSAARTVILSHSLWRNRFHARPDLIGTSLTFNNERYTIVGVMPASFVFPEIDGPGAPPDVCTPLRFTDQRAERGSGYMRMVARLKAGVDPQTARAEFQALSRQFAESQPRAYGGKVLSVLPLRENIVGDVRKLLFILLGAVVSVLIITCTNLANLLLVRATVRIRELAVRSSLGASHGRLIRQLLTENLALALCGGALGLGLASILIRALPAAGLSDLPRAGEISVDGWIAGFSFGLAALTGLFFGVLPAWRISRIDPQRSLREAGRAGGGRHANRLRVVFGVAQLSLALILVSAAGLLLRSFLSLRKADLGFQPQNVITFQLPLPRDLREPQRRAAFYGQVGERIARLPGVRNVGMINYLPLAGNVFGWGILIEGRQNPPGVPGPQAEYRVVSGNLFSALGIRIKAGREFDERDRAGSLPAGIVNETMARRYWPDENPIGKRFRLGGPPLQFPWITIVGIAGDVRFGDVEAAAEPTIYQPLAQTPGPQLSVVVRGSGDPMTLVTFIRGQIREVDRTVPLLNIREFDYFISRSLARRRLVLVLLLTFGMFALFLAAFGLYTVISHSVTQRTQEIGVRVALGADEAGVLKLILKQAIWISLAGISTGVAGTLALGSILKSLLYDVAPADPLTIGSVSLILVLVTVVACYYPARRALRLDPVAALRHE